MKPMEDRITILISPAVKRALDSLRAQGYNASYVARMALVKELRLRKVLKESEE